MLDNKLYPECDYWSAHRRQDLPELLAPAGSLEHLKAAVKAGADAVYMGGQQFGARAYARNLDADNLREALHYAHLHGRKLFLTVNTLMKEEEINRILYGFLLPYYEAGLDGVIVQDLGTASFIRRNFPDLEIHGSTQMTITHSQGALAAKALGMTRIVPARELSLKELSEIKEQTGLELEVFIHGALCFCYSGQCLLSSFYGGRSGNRGRCAQPCRLPYRNAAGEEACFLSPRDLCSLEVLPQLIESDVDSLKIEGRMKNVDYVAGVTAIYRKYLDLYARLKQEGHPEGYRMDEEDMHTLEELYCRGSFTDGYWKRHNGPEMMASDTQKNLGRRIGKIVSVGKHNIHIRLNTPVHPRDILVIPTTKDQETVLTVPSQVTKEKQISLNVPDARRLRPSMTVYRRRNEELSEKIQKNILETDIRYPVKAEVVIRQEAPSEVRMFCRGIGIHIEGPAADAAQNRAITKDDIEKQFMKTGTVPFFLEECAVVLQENSFLPLSALKKLRQDAYSSLTQALERAGDRDVIPDKDDTMVHVHASCIHHHDQAGKRNKSNDRIAVVYDISTLDICLSLDFYSAICLPMDMWDEGELIRQGIRIAEAGKKALLSLPAVMRHGADDWDDIVRNPYWDGIYVHNINEAYYLSQMKELENKCIAGASLYHWNRQALEVSKKLFGISSFQLPLELAPDEYRTLLRDHSSEGAEKRETEIPAELMVYGHVPLMVSAQCQKMNLGLCDHKKETKWLMDSHRRKLPLTTHCEYCYNRLWSHEPINLIGRDFSEIADSIPRYSFDFFGADRLAPGKIMKQFLEWEKNGYCNFMKSR